MCIRDRYKAYYSLDREDGIENDVLAFPPPPEELYVRKENLTELYAACLLYTSVPRETPQMEYHQMIRERNAIGNRMNQISARANATGFFLAEEYKENYKRLMEKVLEIQAAVTLPDRW